MTTEITRPAQWSRDSWGRVSSCLLAIMLAWWPVAGLLDAAVSYRFMPGEYIAGCYFTGLGLPSWLMGVTVAGARFAGPGNSVGKWSVFVFCCLPLPLTLVHAHVFVAQLL